MFLGVQVETMLSITSFEGRSLVAQAAFSGDKATFDAVTTALATRLPPEEVRYRLFSLLISLVKIYEPFSYAAAWTRLLSRGHYAHWKSSLDLNCHEETVNKKSWISLFDVIVIRCEAGMVRADSTYNLEKTFLL